MELVDFRSQLEADLSWRIDEIRFFKNQLSNLNTDDDKNTYRKSLVLILYSHFEGFTKLALMTYVQYINALDLKIRCVTPVLKAAAMNKEFVAYDNFDRKSEIFRKALPEDRVLHRNCRRIEFLEELCNFYDKTVNLPDDLVDTESNLKYKVLQKNLYQLDICIDSLSEYETYIGGLLGKRNIIAHGSKQTGISEHDYSNWESKHFELMNSILNVIYESARESKFLYEE